MLGEEEPKRDPRPWVRGGEAEPLVLDQEISWANGRKRLAATAEQWHEANVDVRRSKRRRLTWLKDREPQLRRTEPIKGCFWAFRDLSRTSI